MFLTIELNSGQLVKFAFISLVYQLKYIAVVTSLHEVYASLERIMYHYDQLAQIFKYGQLVTLNSPPNFFFLDERQSVIRIQTKGFFVFHPEKVVKVTLLAVFWGEGGLRRKVPAWTASYYPPGNII